MVLALPWWGAVWPLASHLSPSPPPPPVYPPVYQPKKIAIGIAPLGFISIGVVPMGVITIGIVPMGVISLGVVAMGVVNASVVGMGIISAGFTTMGIVEWSPSGQEHVHHGSLHHSRNHSDQGIIKNNTAYSTKAEAENQAQKIGCNGVHRMGNLWMPCSTHKQ